MMTFPRATADTFQLPEWTDEALQEMIEFWEREQATAIAAANAQTASNLAWCEYKIELASAERARRRRIKFWKPANGERRRDLVALAGDLKACWPIDRFLTDLMLVQLNPAGRDRWRCHCMTGLHDDVHPSMVAFGDSNHVHCFTCQFHGDIIDLTKLQFGTSSFSEAVRRLADATAGVTGSDAA
jgi:hypothetical protein